MLTAEEREASGQPLREDLPLEDDEYSDEWSEDDEVYEDKAQDASEDDSGQEDDEEEGDESEPGAEDQEEADERADDLRKEERMDERFQEFNRVTSQILDRLEKSEERAHELQIQLQTREHELKMVRKSSGRPDSAASRDKRRKAARKEPVSDAQQGYVPPKDHRLLPLDKHMQQTLLMTPADYTFPKPTDRYSDRTNRAEPADVEMTGQEETARNQSPPVGMQPLPKPSDGGEREKQPSRLWDAWEMTSRPRNSQPRQADEPGAPADNNPVPRGERRGDLRADPFLTVRVEAAMQRQGSQDQPSTGRGKSGLTRTAQDAAKVEIMWPHHRV